MSEKPKPDPARRRVSVEYETFMNDISGVLPHTSEMKTPTSDGAVSEQGEILGDDEKIVRIWPDLADRIIEEIR